MPPAHKERETLQAAFKQFQAGDLRQARLLYGKVLRNNARCVEAHHLLAHVNAREGRIAEAEACFQRVIALNPSFVDGHFNYGVVLSSLGRHSEALKHYQAALRVDPKHDDARRNIIASLIATKQIEAALEACDGAIAINPSSQAFDLHAVILCEMQRFDDALVSHARALDLDPNSAESHFNLGATFTLMKQRDEALKSFENAIRHRYDYAEAYFNRALLLYKMGRLELALRSYDEAIKYRPGYAQAHKGRGVALGDLQRCRDAVASLNKAVALDPTFVEAHSALGRLAVETERFDDAFAHYDRAIELAPHSADAHFDRASLLLLLGRFTEGWSEYEWRKKRSKRFGLRSLDCPHWDGEAEVNGKPVAIMYEQVLGDGMHFVRYVKLLEQRGAKVLMNAPASLHKILAAVSPTVRFFDDIEQPPPVDFQCALMSLPFVFKTTAETIPSFAKYLSVDPNRSASWGKRIGRDGFKIGISWQGRRSRIDIGRSFPLERLRPIGAIPGVRLISLQKHDGSEQLGAVADMHVESLGDGFDDGPDAFLDCAAAMMNLDLVITCDTAVAHLAGALGRPAWVALKRVPEWRWTLHGAESRWHPSLRLFRQTQAGDWTNVFQEMAQAVADTINNKG